MTSIPFTGRTRPVFLSLAGLLSLSLSPASHLANPSPVRPEPSASRGYVYSVAGNPADVVTNAPG